MSKIKITILSFLTLGAVALTSCSNVEDKLEFSDDVYVSSMEAVDTKLVSPNDTVWFKFLVSTPAGAIKTIDLEIDESVATKVPLKSKFSAYDAEQELTMDGAGNLSRDISTVIVEYPVVIKENPEVIGRTFYAVLKATNQAGNVGSNHVVFVGSNVRINKTLIRLQDKTRPDNTCRMFFDPDAMRGYSINELFIPVPTQPDEGDGEEVEDPDEGDDEGEGSKDEETYEEKLAKAEKIRSGIGLMVSFTYYAGDTEGTLDSYKIYSPDDDECEYYLKTSGTAFDLYDCTKMNHTVFMRIDDVNDDDVLERQIASSDDNNVKTKLINQRRDNDYAYFDEVIDEDYLRELDFSKAVPYMTVKGGLYAFRLQDGRRGVIHLNYPNCFGNVAPIASNRCIVQNMSVEQ